MKSPLRLSALAAPLTCLILSTLLAATLPDGTAPVTIEPAESACVDGAHSVGVCGKANALRMRHLAGLPVLDEPGQDTREADDATDLLHNNLDIEINTTATTITGSNTMTVESRIDGLTEFTFRLRSNFTVTQALLNGTTPATVTSLSTTSRKVTLDRAYNTGEVFTVKISYNGVPVSRGFGSIEFTRQHGFGPQIVYTLSEPYFAYTWWPCKDGDFGMPGNNRDKATLELAVTAPSTMRTVSNGVLVGIDALSGGRSRYRWWSDYPIATYLVCFSSTQYNTWTQTFSYGGETMPVEFNIYPSDDTAGNRAGWEACVPMLGTFSDLYGLYPFFDEKYGIYECEFGGGMEHQSNTAQGGFSEDLTSHELSHQWWGDNVTCATWNDIWLNEGSATYSEALWLEFKNGFDNRTALYNAMDARRPSSVGDSVYVYDVTDMNRIFDYNYSYLKAGWVLHQLRKVLGDENYFDMLWAYRIQYGGSGATTDDFANVAATFYSGGDLSWFFDEWVYGIGAPAYQTGWQTVSINGQNYLRLYVNQTQSASYGLYTMPIDVRVNYSGGNQTYTIFNNADPEWFVIPIPAAATSIVLDENDWVLTTAKTNTTYANGPPKVVQASPAPGANYAAGSEPTQASISFSENVTAAAGDFTVVGANAGSVPFSYAYSAGNFTATLTFSNALSGDTYTVTVDDNVSSSVASIALDGEIADPVSPTSLPSGEGVAGGNAVWTFTVEGSCFGDLTGDGLIDLTDLSVLLTNFGTGSGATYEDGDLDSDGDVDLLDLSDLLIVFGTTC